MDETHAIEDDDEDREVRLMMTMPDDDTGDGGISKLFEMWLMNPRRHFDNICFTNK